MRRLRSMRFRWIPLVLLFGSACVTGRGPGPVDERASGLASWYGEEYAGRTTANGEIFDPHALTAAHRTLPFGTIVQVVNPRNARSVNVRINDRGPFIQARVIDVSYAAAEILDMVNIGVTPVELTVLKIGDGDREPPRPYVVAINPAPSRASETGKPVIRDEPPPVPFPLPDTAAPAESRTRLEAREAEDGFRIEVVEERGGQIVRKQVAADGTSVEIVGTGTASASAEPRRIDSPIASGWILQLGAFRIAENASQLRSRVAAVSPSAFVEEQGGFHRVRVGPFLSKTAAIDAQERLDSAGFPSLLLSLD